MKSLFAKFRRLDWVMLASMLFLIGIGVRFIQSAGGVRITPPRQSSFFT